MPGLATALIMNGPVFGPEKLAVSVLLPSAANVKFAFVLTILPASVQLKKARPFAGVAVTVTFAPGAKMPPPVTEPPADGSFPKVMVTGTVAASRTENATSPAVVMYR